MLGVDRHVEWGHRREPSLHARRGGRVKHKWSTVKLLGIDQQDGELLTRLTGQTPSAENTGTPNPFRKRLEERHLLGRIGNKAAKTAARVESCNDKTSSRDEFFHSTGATKAKSISHFDPRQSPCPRDFTPGSSQTIEHSLRASDLSYHSDESSVRGTWIDSNTGSVCRKVVVPPPDLTSDRILREANDTIINRLERFPSVSELEMCERGFCSYCGTSFSNASAVQVCTQCNSIGTVKKPHLVGPGVAELESSINHPNIRDEAVVWSGKEDSKLLTLKNADVSWASIASILEKDQGECKQRFETIKPRDWKLHGAKEKESGDKDARKKKGPVSTAGVAGSGAMADWMKDDYQQCSPTYSPRVLVPGGCDISKLPSVEDDWAQAFNLDPASGWGQPSTNAVPKPEPAPYKPFRVTYWANVESDSSLLRVPIDGKYVYGPEKTIATHDLPKVWKWVHDKGLGDKVSLQDAFDLARSMHKSDIYVDGL